MHATPKPALALVFAGLAAAPAAAQITESEITMHLTWREATVSGSNVPAPNGILDPGEWALISIDSVSCTNQFETVGIPPIGTFTSGLIVGLGSGVVDINGSGGTAGTFVLSAQDLNLGVRSAWRTDGDGTVNAASDGVHDIRFGQAPANPDAANSSNPIANMYRMLWRPAALSARTATFTLAGAASAGANIAALYIALDGATGANIAVDPAHVHFNSIRIPMVPEPPAFAVLLLPLMPRRRGSP